MHLSQNKASSWHPPHPPIPKTLRSLTHLVALEALANRSFSSPERGWKGVRCHQSHTKTSRSKEGQRQFSLLPLLWLYFQIARGDWLEARILVFFLAGGGHIWHGVTEVKGWKVLEAPSLPIGGPRYFSDLVLQR